jgi:hypothetical protein
MAVERGYVEMCYSLLEKGADVEAKDEVSKKK